MPEGATTFLGYLSHESKDFFDLKSMLISAKIKYLSGKWIKPALLGSLGGVFINLSIQRYRQGG
jgi:hypothetical protein